jgi:CRP-like cAMP-binding protein
MEVSSADSNGTGERRSAERLRGNRFLASLPIEIVERLEPHFREVNLNYEDYLTHQDEPVDWIYFPVTAVVSEFQMLEDGRTIEVAIIGNEGAVAASSMLGERPAINSSQVYVAGSALRIRVEYFHDRLFRNEDFERTLHSLIESQMKQLSQRLICTTFHSMEQRLCTWLLRMNDRVENDRFQITHEHIARSLGVHRPSISATLQALRERGLFDYRRARMRMQDLDGLAELACLCYTNDSHK